MVLNILLIATIALLVVSAGFQIAKTCSEISKKNKASAGEAKDGSTEVDSESEAGDAELREEITEIVDDELDKRGFTCKNKNESDCKGGSDIPEEDCEDVIIIPRVTLEEVAKTEVEEPTSDVKDDEEAKEEQTVTAETANESAERPTDNADLKAEEIEETDKDEKPFGNNDTENEEESEEDDETDDETEEVENGEDSVFSKIVRKPRVPFAKKILDSEDNIKSYYDGICNAFGAYRHVGCRVSKRSASFRYHRELIAKITVHGKTVKLNLALDPKAFDENVYHQKDLSEKKAYSEVPFTLKLKSDRGYKHALELVDAVAEKVGAEKKTRVNPVDYIAKLQEKLN